jgi:LuxR family maltose regulon positive regulatory protein
VLDHQPPEVARLLLRTSVLERVSGPLADRLTGSTGSERILVELEDASAFVLALDPQRSWFRYHHLLADLLALELRRTSPGELPALHTAAAEWHAEHGLPVEAVRHAVSAENWPLATELLSDHWLGLTLDGRRPTAHELLHSFPADMLVTDPRLACVAAADELAVGSLDDVERYLAVAASAASAVPENRRVRFELTLATLRLSAARARNDVAAVAREAERLLGRADSLEALPPGLGGELRAIAFANLGMSEIWTGRRDHAERHLEQAYAEARRIERPLLEVLALSQLALLAAFRSTALAAERSRQAIDLARANGWEDELLIGVAYGVLGAVTLWEGRLVEAEEWLGRADTALRGDAEPATAMMVDASRGLLELVRGRHEEALTAFREADRLASLVTTHSLAPLVRAQMLVTQVQMGRIDEVQRVLDEMDERALATYAARVVLAALRLAQDRPQDAVTELEPLLEDVEIEPSDAREAIQGLILGAIAFDLLGDAGGASRALERALDLAEPNGFVLPFLLFPARELLVRHARFRTAHASLISDVLTLLSGKAPQSPAPWEVEPLDEPLSDSELRVLRYLPTNLRAPEIAAELFVSVNTIRTHMRHVYAKLGVHRRAEAVERARELGLLAPAVGRR